MSPITVEALSLPKVSSPTISVSHNTVENQRGKAKLPLTWMAERSANRPKCFPQRGLLTVLGILPSHHGLRTNVADESSKD